MTLTDATETAPPHSSPSALPPFSGDGSLCPKCLYPDARTYYRPAAGHVLVLREFNGVTKPCGPLPERLQRECSRCDFSWDEALATDSAEAVDTDRPEQDGRDTTGYPRQDGDFVILGPEIFTDIAGTVICWKGENYVRQSDAVKHEPAP